MPTIWTFVRATAILVGSSAALLAGGIAHADPVPAPVQPDIPQQLIASAANAPQILQNLATALGSTPPLNGILSAPATAATPGLTPTAGAPAGTSYAPATMPTLPGVNAPIPGIASPPAAATTPAGVPAIPGVNSPLAPATPASVPSVPGLGTQLPGFGAPATAATPASVLPGLATAIPGLAQAALPALTSGIPGIGVPGAGPQTLLGALP
ncbi:hypothetical protein [Mycobacterium sp.]|uniref:hypothetical protein n=1 Tax=Mycobacterium sp. TaxID=1785 RepID=UPI003A8C5B28